MNMLKTRRNFATAVLLLAFTAGPPVIAQTPIHV